MTRGAVIGRTGQLGSDLVKILRSYKLSTLSHSDIDYADFDLVRAAIAAVHPGIVVNCTLGPKGL
jgi:dTDP-4-dehydrorhamnose reductase